jgi:uncharacterized ubiquitin-like protein YukD
MKGTADFTVEQTKTNGNWISAMECGVKLSGDKKIVDFIIKAISCKVECHEDMRIR